MEQMIDPPNVQKNDHHLESDQSDVSVQTKENEQTENIPTEEQNIELINQEAEQAVTAATPTSMDQENIKAVNKEHSKNDNDNIQTEAHVKTEGGNVQKSANISLCSFLQELELEWQLALCRKQERKNIKARTCKLCDQIKEMLQKLEKHMRKNIKKFKYKCCFCSKLYETKNSLYKHKLYHTIGLWYICKKCDKAFMFFSQYQEHLNVHTDSIKNKYLCRKTGCDKYYGSTCACNYHKQHHKARNLKCTFQEKKLDLKCITCDSQQSLHVQVHGTHRERVEGTLWLTLWLASQENKAWKEMYNLPRY